MRFIRRFKGDPCRTRVTARRSASVKDVAPRAGVSLGTVSNVLNRPDRVSAATRTRVEDAMAELGFVRNESARQLRAGRSRTIAYVMLDATNPFFTDVAPGIEHVAEDRTSRSSCATATTAPPGRRRTSPTSRSSGCRASWSPRSTPTPPASPTSRAAAPRWSSWTAPVPDAALCTVAVDDVLGGRLAVEHLVDRGHQRVAFVGGPDSLGQVRERLEGARPAWRGRAGRRRPSSPPRR